MNQKLKEKSSLPLIVLIAALFVFTASALISLLVFEGIPHLHDEVAYLFQAKIFQLGKLYVPSPCLPEAFDFTHIINNGRWYSQYPPGFPLLLLLGLLIKLPWLINPLLAGIATMAIYYLGREMYDQSTGLVASLLLAASFWFWVISATMMSHTASLLFGIFLALSVFRSQRNPTLASGLATGISWGAMFLVRPFSAVTFSLPLIILFGWTTLRRLHQRWKNALAALLTALLFIGLFLFYNQLTNGHPLRVGYEISHGKEYIRIFGRAAYLDYEYTPLFGARQIWDNLKALNRDLFGWPGSSFLALLPFLWRLRERGEKRKKDLSLLLCFLSLVAGHFFFWGTVLTLGARMFFESVFIVALLSSRGLLLVASWRPKKRPLSPFTAKSLTFLVLGVFFIYAFLVRFPRFLAPAGNYWFQERLIENFAGVNKQLNLAVQDVVAQRPALIIMKLLYHPNKYFPTGHWGSGFINNDPLLASDIIYCRNVDEKNTELATCFPHHQVYLYYGTIQKGLLYPLLYQDGRYLIGQPLTSLEAMAKFTWLADPLDFFTLYNNEFRSYLSNLLASRPPATVDVPFLLSLGQEAQKRGRFAEAAWCYEAALQIENDPHYRYILLSRLLPCYLKTKQMREARQLLSVLQNPDNPYLYNVLPERGF